MAYTAPTTVSGSTLITKSLVNTDHYGNWEWFSSFEQGGVSLNNGELPIALGAGVWHWEYEPGADFASINCDLSGLATRFRKIKIIGANFLTDRVTHYDNILLTFANDKAITYYYSWYRVLRATPFRGQSMATVSGIQMVWAANGAGAANDCYGNFEVTIHQPREVDYPYVHFSAWKTDTTTDQIAMIIGGGHYYQSGAIDRFDLDPSGGTTFLSGGANEPTTRIDVYAYYGAED